jgi:hypothetical protein
MGKRSQEVQRQRREADITPEYLMDLKANPSLCDGDVIGSLEWRDFRTGKVTRWTVLRGDRVNNIRLRAPNGRSSKSHGWAWVLEKVRAVILRR